MPVVKVFDHIEKNDKRSSETEILIYGLMVGDIDPLYLLHHPRGSAEKSVSLFLQKICEETTLDLTKDERNISRFREILRKNFFKVKK